MPRHHCTDHRPRTCEQVVDNLGAVDVVITDDDVAQIDTIVAPQGWAVRYYDAATGTDFRPSVHRSIV